MAMKTIPKQAHSVQVELEQELPSHRGQLLARIGRPEEGIKDLEVSYEVIKTDDPAHPRFWIEMAWGAENLANGVATVNDWPRAVKLQEEARDNWLKGDPSSWAAILKKSMGTTLLWAGQLDRARVVLTEGIKQVESTEPYNWATAA
jgi:hypothetical protein